MGDRPETAELSSFVQAAVGELLKAIDDGVMRQNKIPGLESAIQQFQGSLNNYDSNEPSRPSLKDIAAAKGGGIEI